MALLVDSGTGHWCRLHRFFHTGTLCYGSQGSRKVCGIQLEIHHMVLVLDYDLGAGAGQYHRGDVHQVASPQAKSIV